MKRYITVFILAIALVINFSSSVYSQDDCCGIGSIFSSLIQSGIFGGYGLQQYSAKGLNEVLPQDAGFKDYGTAWGWRVGANVIQVRQRNILIGLKFYYQSMTESQERVEQDFTQEISLKLTQWNFGLSLSYIASQAFDIRIFDAYLSWTGAELTNKFKTDNPPEDDVYKSPEASLGFTADAGIVWYPIPTATYMSLEVLGGYSLFSIDEAKLKEGTSSLQTIQDIVDGGGFFAVAVLTVGIPFN